MERQAGIRSLWGKATWQTVTLVVTALAGDWNDTVAFAEQYREGWEDAGRPHDGDLNRGAYAAATVYGLRDEPDLRATWLDIVDVLLIDALADRDRLCYAVFDAVLRLHQGQYDDALSAVETPSPSITGWREGLWRPWQAALWAEASVLAGVDDCRDRLRRAAGLVAGNTVAAVLLDRAAALYRGDIGAVRATAGPLMRLGCRYQQARSLVLAGGSTAVDGHAILAGEGARRMVTPDAR